jgi:hypothetical protein
MEKICGTSLEISNITFQDYVYGRSIQIVKKISL